MSNDELKRRLENMASRQVPPVDGRFANRLEADLRAASLEGSRRNGFLTIFLRPAGIMVMAALLIGGVFIVRSNGDAPTLEFASAEGTSVSIPGDAELRDGVAGLELPDGTRIEVAADGSATVAGVVLEADTVAVIVDGRLELVEAPSATATSVVDAETDRTTSTAPTTTIATDRPVVSDPTTSLAPDPSDSPPVTDVKPADATTTTTSTTTTVTTAAPTTTAPPTPATERPVDESRLKIHLEVSAAQDRRVTLNWRPNRDDPDIAGWEVRIRKGDGVRALAVLRQRGARRLQVEASGRDVSYRIIARAEDGSVLARSEFVALG